MERPLVSVIIVNYNAGKLLAKSVKSVIDFPGVEVVVADNASRDTSFTDLVKGNKYKNLILIDNGANIGFGKAVNGAALKSHGDYIYLLNPDAELSKKALSRMVETAKSYQDRCIVAPRLENPDGTPQSSCYKPQTIVNAIKEYWLGKKGSYGKYLPAGKNPVEVNAAVAAAWLVPKKVWEELEGLSDRYFLYFEDLDMCDRARAHGIPIIYDPGAVVKHAHGVSSRTNPIVLKLFTNSAWTYHGPVKKLIIDFIIRVRDLFIPPVSNKKLAGIFVAFILLVTFITFMGVIIVPSSTFPSPYIPAWAYSNPLIWSFANFDGLHYLGIATRGYENVFGKWEYAFFPLLPLLTTWISKLGLDVFLASRLVTLTSLAAFIYFGAMWAEKYLKNPLTLLWLVLLSSGSVFLLSVYTEPLFLALAAATFYYADREEWGKATLATALATATRVNGVFLILFLLIKLLRSSVPKLKSMFYILLSSSGLLAYMYYLRLVSGSPFSWYTAQSDWGKASPTYPWETFIRYLQSITIDFKPDLIHLVVVVEIIVTTILIYLLVRAWRSTKLDVAYKWYALGSLALPIATGSLGSMPRFALTLFPLLLVVPTLPSKQRTTYYVLSTVLAVLGIILFTRGYWWA